MNQLTMIPSGTTQPSSAKPIAVAVKSRTHTGTLRTLSINTTCLAVAAGLVLAACSKQGKAPEVTQADAVPLNPEAPTNAQEQARIAQAVALRQGIAPAAPAITLRGGEPATPEVLKAYNQELLRYIFREKDAPETMQELVRIKTLPRLPTAPPGKRIVYDPANHIIRLDPP